MIQKGTFYLDVLRLHFILFKLGTICTSLLPVELLMPFWTVNLEGLSALVWHTFSLQLTYNSKQNYTKPITKRMGVKNQSHVSWRSVSRHFIRSLRVEFNSCTFLTPGIYWLSVFSRKAWGADTDLWCRGAHSLWVFHRILFLALYNLEFSVMCTTRFNEVTSRTSESQLPVVTQNNFKMLQVISE